jgi:hypothetical protein
MMHPIRNNAAPSTPAASELPPDSPFRDRAREILEPVALSDDLKSQAWEHFYSSASPADLHARLQTLSLSVDLHNSLLEAKTASMPKPDPVMNAIARMKTLPADPLELAECHPVVLKLITDAALKSE